MKNEKENEDIIDISIGKIRLRIPNDRMSVAIAKMHVEALYNSYLHGTAKCTTQEIQVAPVSTTQNISIAPVQESEVKQLPVIEEQKEVKVETPTESYTICPLCAGALKKKKIKQVGNEVKQKVLCKNRKCKFERDYVFSL